MKLKSCITLVSALSCLTAVASAYSQEAEPFAAAVEQYSEVREIDNNRWTKAFFAYHAGQSMRADAEAAKPAAKVLQRFGEYQIMALPVSGVPHPTLPETERLIERFCQELPGGDELSSVMALPIGNAFSEILDMERTETEDFYMNQVNLVSDEAASEISSIAMTLPATETRLHTDYASMMVAEKDLLLPKYRSFCSKRNQDRSFR